uniref:NAD kinase 2, mitochondrial n=1 Tax=Oncorhynchus kisutch TaxID=8019 RepID=A0A8C7MFP0_ONCKI
MTPRSFINCLCLGHRAVTILNGSSRHIQMEIQSIASQAEIGFKPAKVAVVTKMTRHEFEQQRYRFSELSEEDLKQLWPHDLCVSLCVPSRKEGIEVSDAIISAGGDGTIPLLVASKVFNKDQSVLGVNTDPERSEGHLCLPVCYTHAFPEALQKLHRGQFRWQWRQRIRLHLEGTGINPIPVDLHEQQLSLEQHSQAHRLPLIQALLPVRGLNEIIIGESLSSRASYYEISVDDGPWEKQKSSGLSICTGTRSKAWSYNTNNLVEQAVEDVLRIGMKICIHESHCLLSVTDEYNESLVFEPIVNRVFSSSRQRGFANRVCARSRCWDSCMVGLIEFNDGAIATITINEEDQLLTVLLEN